METIQVFRIEDKSRRGIYQIGGPAYKYNEPSKHPGPYSDSSLATWAHNYLEATHFFGFKSLDQLKMWAYKKSFRQALVANDYIIAVYIPRANSSINSSDYIAGDTQTIFRRHKFKVKEKLNLLEI